jgi:SPP1 family phage portal protein
MEELLAQLATAPAEVIAKIKLQSKDFAKIEEYKKEFYKHDRTIRPEQVGIIQKDKPVGTGEKSKNVKAVRIPINFPKKIVTTATAFEVGKPVTLVASIETNLSKLIDQIWKSNRINAAIQKMITIKKTETQSAIQFYIVDLDSTSRFNKVLNFFKLGEQKKEIKAKVLDNTSGKMTPYFDGNGNMILFMWEYATQEGEKTVNNVQIWDAKNFHNLNDSSGNIAYSESSILPHGFDRIPIVYTSQEEPEWFDVKELIDRMETSLSKLGGSNDYSAYPLLMLFGKVDGMPDKDDDGKVLQFPMEKDDDGKYVNGKAEFLTASNATESIKLELENLKGFIYSISQTPDLSFDNVKGLGSVSGVALKLLFLDAMIKALSNEGENRTMIERIINIIMSGISVTTNTKMSTEAASLYYDIIFNSIIPDDLKTASEIITSLRTAGLLSKATAIKLLDLVEDPAAELELINAEAPEIVPLVI